MSTHRFVYTWVVVIFRCVITLIGIPGNVLILAVYWDKQALGSAQVFIQALALSDIYVCSLFPLEIHFWLFEFDYTDQFLCKLFFTLTSIGFYMSICITVSIAIDRYLAVAKPVNGRWSRQKAQKIAIFCLFVAVFINLAVPFASQVNHREVEGVLNGTSCYKQQPGGNGLLYYLVTIPQYLSCLVAFIFIGILYAKLWIVVARQRKKIGAQEVRYDNNASVAGDDTSQTGFTQTSAVAHSVTVVQYTGRGSSPVLDDTADNDETAKNTKDTTFAGGDAGKLSRSAISGADDSALQRKDAVDHGDTGQYATGNIDIGHAYGKPVLQDGVNHVTESEDQAVLNEVQKSGGFVPSDSNQDHGRSIPRANTERPVRATEIKMRRGKRQSPVSRLSIMLLLTTAIFFFTWLVTLVTFGLTSVTRKFFGNNIVYSIIAVLRLSGLINNAINPLLYSFLNPRFRAHCRVLFKRLKSRLTRSLHP